MAKPTIKFSEDDIRKVEELAASVSKQHIADYFNICFNTLEKIFERQPEASEAFKRGRAMCVISIATSVIREAQSGNMTAAALYLKTQAGWSETEKREITGADGGPIKQDTVWTINVVGE